MASIRITQFGGLLPDLSSRLKPPTTASVAHNCILVDGALRPQAKWARQSTYNAGTEPTVKSLAYDPSSDRASLYVANDVVLTTGEPMPDRMAYGATGSPSVSQFNTNLGFNGTDVAVYNVGITGSVSYERAFLSYKPVNRVYAVSRVRRVGNRVEEGALCVVIGDPKELVYEGDTATIQVALTPLDDNATHFRLYRSISGLDTGEEVNNPLDTHWHLIDEVPTFNAPLVVYVDGGSVTGDPLDVNYSGQFHPPNLAARHFGLTESGWFVAVSQAGQIHVSERYLPHAWPSDNLIDIHEEITDIAIHKDNVYVGTKSFPFVVAIQQGEKGVQLAATQYTESYPCIEGSMTASSSGALYASTAGIVALGLNGVSVLTNGLAKANDKLFIKHIPAELSASEEKKINIAAINKIGHAIYYKGSYIAFCTPPPDNIFFYTSTPYPVEVIETGLTGSLTPTLGVLGPNYTITSPLPETIQASISIDNGVLRSILIDYSIPDGQGEGVPGEDNGFEYLLASISLLESELRTILQQYALVEEIEASLSVFNGTLETILIQYSAAPEEISGTLTITSGTLI